MSSEEFPLAHYLEEVGKALQTGAPLPDSPDIQQYSLEDLPELQQDFIDIIQAITPIPDHLQKIWSLDTPSYQTLYIYAPSPIEYKNMVLEPTVTIGYDTRDTNTWVYGIEFTPEDNWVQQLYTKKKEGLLSHQFYDQLIRGLNVHNSHQFPDLYDPKYNPQPSYFEINDVPNESLVYKMRKPLNAIDFYSYPYHLLSPTIRIISNALEVGRYSESKGLLHPDNKQVIQDTKKALVG